jgi:hypothetical protein
VRTHGPIAAGIAALLLAAPAPASAQPACRATAATPVPQPTADQLAAAGLGTLPVAPDSRRVDLVAPPFSHPTEITNPLFPISRLASAVLNGRVEGKPFHTETTLLPGTRMVEWSDGQCVETLVSQYVAFLGGRIQEGALDLYAQADDGSVWYFGEEVFDYAGGVVLDTSDSWLAGRDGPAAMIMPADPRVGQVSRAENLPGRVFEEVAVKRVGVTVKGPTGPVRGAMVGRELHDDGTFSDKIFAPGYGEFFTASNGELEALAVAVPTDAVAGPPPRALTRMSAHASAVLRAAGRARWRSAAASTRSLAADWRAVRAGGVPRRLVAPAVRALRAVDREVRTRRRARARSAALDVTQAALDLELRYRPPATIDRARFALWTRRLELDAAARDRPAAMGDVATLEWVRDRIHHVLGATAGTRLDAQLLAVRSHVIDRNLPAAARTARALRRTLARAASR